LPPQASRQAARRQPLQKRLRPRSRWGIQGLVNTKSSNNLDY
jgi:hypothetical protein